ncbi:hypothetical protein HanRHA438_Chr10g0479431 [Helianthus annuus]|nr:hypothetical protein HanRHA438_Chr10g0479431 [Helianthus annuus]
MEIRKDFYIQVLAHQFILIEVDFQKQDFRVFLSRPAKLKISVKDKIQKLQIYNVAYNFGLISHISF